MTSDASWTLRVRDFRALHEVEWSPAGVCLLAGPNGSGKTTLLRSLRFLRDLYLRGLGGATRFAQGAAGFRRVGTPPEGLVIFEIERGEVKWRVSLPLQGPGIHPFFGERLERGGAVIFDAAPFASEWTLGADQRRREDRSALRTLWDKEEPAWLAAFVQGLRGFRVYDALDVETVTRPEPGDEGDHYLHPRGKNLLPVLRNWQGAPKKFRDQYAWVVAQTRQAFPDLLEAIEFEVGADVKFFHPGASRAEDGIPIHLAADGLLTGLLHLTAVAGAQDGGTVAIDEMENQLHPHAIRSILGSIREMAARRGLTVILTTHSPVLMDEFGACPDQFYVLDRGAAVQPVPLDRLKDPGWLAMFSLGTLYDRMKFGAPPVVTPGADEDTSER